MCGSYMGYTFTFPTRLCFVAFLYENLSTYVLFERQNEAFSERGGCKCIFLFINKCEFIALHIAAVLFCSVFIFFIYNLRCLNSF